MFMQAPVNWNHCMVRPEADRNAAEPSVDDQ